jgi:fatty-acyl-CoA synthase/long-chain acyl-CoA synthetase
MDWNEVLTVGDLLVRGARTHPDRDAIVLPDERRTYVQLLDGAMNVARGLLGLGVKPGDKVGLLAANGSEFVEAFFGVELFGGIIVPLNARHKAIELGYIAENADLVAVLTTAEADAYVDFSAVLSSALPSLAGSAEPAALDLPEAPALRAAIILNDDERDGFMSRAELNRRSEEVDPARVEELRRRVRLRDVGSIIYTSGTTANPKGCMLSHEAMTRGAAERAMTRFGTGDADVTWGPGPLFHIGTLAPFLGSMAAVGTYLTDVFYEPGRALDLIEAEGATVAIPWFAAIIQGLLDHPEFSSERLKTMRSMLLIGPRSLLEKVMTMLPDVEPIQGCGMTEAAGIYAIAEPEDSIELRATAQGKACPGIELRVVDPASGAELPAGESGEMLIRGHCVMEGYFRDPDKTAEALDPDGWLHTGDLYIRLEEGSVVFNGRLKDMLKVGGENVAAIEVEAFLCGHPAVKLAEVVGRPDDRLDEVPVAFVELSPGAEATGEEIIEWCSGRVARYKIPHEVHLIDASEWPMSATKVDKRKLRERLKTLSASR